MYLRLGRRQFVDGIGSTLSGSVALSRRVLADESLSKVTTFGHFDDDGTV